MSNLDFIKEFIKGWKECYSLVEIEGNLYKITARHYGVTMYFIHSLFLDFSPDGFSLTSDCNGNVFIYVDIDKIIPKNKD